MAEERRSGHVEIHETLKEFRQELRDDIKELKDDIKELEHKMHDTVTTNNKFYFNGFEPHKHVSDHHIIDNIIEKVNEDKKSFRKIVEEILKVAAVAAFTWIVVTIWNGAKVEIRSPIEVPKVDARSNIPHP